MEVFGDVSYPWPGKAGNTMEGDKASKAEALKAAKQLRLHIESQDRGNRAEWSCLLDHLYDFIEGNK